MRPRHEHEGMMAADREIQNEIKPHVKSYESFIWMMKWGTILSFITGAIVVLIISS
jgi:hypothetical protein